jgi:hypothetical protein
VDAASLFGVPYILYARSSLSVGKMGKLSASGMAYWAVLLFSWQTAAQQATPVPVVGVQTGIDPRTGQRPARQNINDLYLLGGPQW